MHYCQNLCQYLAKPRGKSNFGEVTVRDGTFLSLHAEITASLAGRKEGRMILLLTWHTGTQGKLTGFTVEWNRWLCFHPHICSDQNALYLVMMRAVWEHLISSYIQARLGNCVFLTCIWMRATGFPRTSQSLLSSFCFTTRGRRLLFFWQSHSFAYLELIICNVNVADFNQERCLKVLGFGGFFGFV